MKAYSINDKLLTTTYPSGNTGQLDSGVTAFKITALPETAAPGGVYDLTNSNYYAITTDVYWKYASSYADMIDPEKRYDFQNMSMIYQFNTNQWDVSNYREFNVTVSTNLRSGYSPNGTPLPIEDAFHPGVYLNSHYTTAGHYNDPVTPLFVNGKLSGNPDNIKSAGFLHTPDPECTEYYYSETWQGYPWRGVSFLNDPYSPYGWTKYKVIGDRSARTISAFCAPVRCNYSYVGYTNLHADITSVNGLYCYDYYSPDRGTCSARNVVISSFDNFNDALFFKNTPGILAY